MKQTKISDIVNTLRLLRVALKTRNVKKKVAENDTVVNRNHQMIIDNMNDTVVGLDILADKFTFVSGSYHKVYGYTAEEYLSKKVREIMTPESYKLVQETIKREFARYFRGEIDQPYATLEIQKYHKDGTPMWTEVSARAIVNNQREIIEIISISRDINDRKKAELKVIEQKEELARINNNKNTFFSITSHDLRNQVTALANIAEILNEYFPKMTPQDAAKHINTLFDSTQILLNLFENILLWSRSVMGGIDMHIHENNINEIIKTTIEEAKIQGSHKQIDILYHNNTPQNNVLCDHFMISSVIRNLLSNAIKFSNVYDKINVIVNPQDNRNQNIIISIKDQGVGMTTEQVNNLFKIDTKTSTLGTANEKGTGLGLILCKEFIDKHQCDIWVESQPGKGTTFNFTLPTKHITNNN